MNALHRAAFAAALVASSGCSSGIPSKAAKELKQQQLYTCCNIYYATGNPSNPWADAASEINDANYHVGALLPLGTPIRITDFGGGPRKKKVEFTADAFKISLYQFYGKGDEPFEQFVRKRFVEEDPSKRLDTLPTDVQDAVYEARLEIGMTRDEVLMSQGYPPTHRTPDLRSNVWIYWYSRFSTYTVTFGRNGLVSRIVGKNAPTNKVAVRQISGRSDSPSATRDFQ